MSSEVHCLGVIPARFGSSRFSGKPLQEINGKPMVYWVYKHVSSAEGVTEAIVATEDRRVADVCDELEMPVMMTSDAHNTPTDRVWEVSTRVDADRYLFVGGDEPLAMPCSISKVAAVSDAPVVHAVTDVTSAPEVIDFTNIKVTMNEAGRMLYSTRSPIPYPRGDLNFVYHKTVGIASFSRDALEFFHNTPKSALERTEENDLIRFIEHGVEIHCINIHAGTLSVDTPKDLEKVRMMCKDIEGF